MDALAYARARVAARIGEWTQGTITLTRTTETAPNAQEPWQPGTETTATYTLDAVVRGAAEHADGTLVLATDLIVIASPQARDQAGDAVALVPALADTITIDGRARKPKRIEPVPAAGSPAKYRIFVAS